MKTSRMEETSRELRRYRDDTYTRALAKSSYKMTAKEFETTLNDEERHALRLALELTLIDCVEQNLPVYLEGLGILLPTTSSCTRAVVAGGQFALQPELVRSVSFEKCYDLTSFHRDRYPQIVETRQLADEIWPRVPRALHWEKRDVQRFLRGFCQLIKEEVVLYGRASPFDSLGHLYALHNRQGTTLADWFAGADIFLEASYERLLRSDPPRYVERPVLRDAWELLEAHYGAPVCCMEVDVAAELTRLHADEALVAAAHGVRFPLAVFTDHLQQSAARRYIFASEGMRRIGLQLPREFVFQLTTTANAYTDDPPSWPTSLFALVWTLLYGAKGGAIHAGAGLCAGGALDGGASSISTIFLTPFTRVPTVQQTDGGDFAYLNILGITSEEARVAERRSPQHLLALLRHRTIDQWTAMSRTSLLQKAHFGEPPRKEPRTRRIQSGEALATGLQ